MLPLDKLTPQRDGWTHATWLAEQNRRRNAVRHRQALGNIALPMTREAELEAIERFISEHGVRRVTLDRQGIVRIRAVRL